MQDQEENFSQASSEHRKGKGKRQPKEKSVCCFGVVLVISCCWFVCCFGVGMGRLFLLFCVFFCWCFCFFGGRVAFVLLSMALLVSAFFVSEFVFGGFYLVLRPSFLALLSKRFY